MRHILLPVFAAVMIAAPAPAQDSRGPQVKYWPMREIGFPVPPDVLQQTPKPTKIRLYSAANGGAFQMVAERSTTALDTIDNRPPGFKYTAKSDSDEEFAVQLVYEDGTVSPRTENLRPEFRIVFDTRPPSVQIAASGQYGVEWAATDDNLDSEGIRLQCRWAGEQRWYEPKTRSSYRTRDSYTWASLANDNRTLEVRVVAKDRAGHEASSRIVTLPASSGATGLGKDYNDTNPSSGTRPGDLTGGGVRNARVSGEDIPGQPQISYVNYKDLMIRTKLTHVTRSGVKAVHLFVKDMSNPNSEWKSDKVKQCDIKYEATDTQVEIPFTAPKEGRYGFIVIPESGVDRRDPDPRPSAPPQQLVEVITTPPVVKIRNVLVSPGGAIGPRVEIEWDAEGNYLMPDPIVLEYALEPTSREWKSIAEKIPNSRRYVWEVADRTLYKFVVRIRAVDKASNTGQHIYEKYVIIDLDRPSATIENIKPTMSGREGGSSMPSSTSKPVITPDPIAKPASPPETLPVPKIK